MKKRLPAEWEKQRAVQFTLPSSLGSWFEPYHVEEKILEMVELISSTQNVFLVISDIDAIVQKLKISYQNTNWDNITLFAIDSNDIWARDHAVLSVEKNNQFEYLHFCFNGWGEKHPYDKDSKIGSRMNLSGYQFVNFVLEGGSLDTDGLGTLLTTKRCLLSQKRNPQYNQEEIEQFLKNQLGLQRILWLENGYLAGDDTDAHIDTLARFVDTQTIVYASCSDQRDEHFVPLQNMKKELEKFKTFEGKPYHLIPLEIPKALFDETKTRLPATYCNFLITNDYVLVPTFGDQEKDQNALTFFQKHFTKRIIKGFNCQDIVIGRGCIHCLSMNIF